jgi:hypothetical protein
MQFIELICADHASFIMKAHFDFNAGCCFGYRFARQNIATQHSAASLSHVGWLILLCKA